MGTYHISLFHDFYQLVSVNSNIFWIFLTAKMAILIPEALSCFNRSQYFNKTINSTYKIHPIYILRNLITSHNAVFHVRCGINNYITAITTGATPSTSEGSTWFDLHGSDMYCWQLGGNKAKNKLISHYLSRRSCMNKCALFQVLAKWRHVKNG